MKSYSVPQESGGMLNLVYWHQDATTYIVCGSLSAEQLSNMVREVHDAAVAMAANPAKIAPAP